jgi:hypothetical protein
LSAIANLNIPICCLFLCVQRRLLQTGQADLVASITYPGTAKGGENLVGACETGACLSKVENAPAITVTSAAVQPGVALADLGDASIAIEAVPYVAGEQYQFTVTYKIGDTLNDAAVILVTDPVDAMYCEATDAGAGLTRFSCDPTKKLSVVQIIASGGNPKTYPPTRVTASVPVYNTSESQGRRCIG